MRSRALRMGLLFGLGMGLLGCTLEGRGPLTPGRVAPVSTPTPASLEAAPAPPIPSASAGENPVAEQVYTHFRAVPSPCCPPRPLPEVLDRLRAEPGIVAIDLQGERLVVRYDPTVLRPSDLPILFLLNGLEVAP